MSNPFFLTHQTAGLMDDFVRELNGKASLFLIYGENGVGKTRLLEELKRTHLADREVHWIDIKADSSGDGSLVDSSAVIEDVFATAQQGDIVIADHFEVGMQKTHHQLFLSWTTEGLDRKTNLIVSSDDRFFDQFQQLAKQYDVPVQNFHLQALDSEETVAFLGFYLFPDRPTGKVSMPEMLQDQLAATHGAIGKIISIAKRHGDQITSTPRDEVGTVPKNSKNVVGILMVVALLLGGAWFYLGWQSQYDDTSAFVNDELATLEVPAPVGEVVRIEAEPEQAEVQPVDPELGEDTLAAEKPTEDVPEATAEAGTASDEDAVLVDETGTELAGQDAEVEVEEVIALLTDDELLPTTQGESSIVSSGVSRLDRELLVSRAWLDRSDKNTGTIQILLLSQDKFDEQIYYDYIDDLAKRGVDTSELKIFKTLTGGREVYSTVYGEYESRNAAADAIEGLPRVLKDISPIPRSVGGLMQEIRRLEAGN